MSVSRNREGVPGWTGDPSSWLEFKQAARLFVASTKYENRYTCGPKIAAELTGAAKTAITGKRSTWLSDPQGAERLLDFLQQTIGEPALPEVGNYMRQYFKVLRRKRGEAMSAFCVRHREEYERMCRSLARMVKEDETKKGGQSKSTPQVSEHGSQAGGDNLEGPRSEENNTESHGSAGNGSWNTVQNSDQQWRSQSWDWHGGWGWYGSPWSSWGWQPQHWQSQSNASEVAEGEDDKMVQILPDAVLGWFLLEKSGLDNLEKSVIQGEIKGDFTLSGVEHALRSHWSDDQVKKRDGEAKHHINFQDEDEDAPEVEDEALFEDWSPEELLWYQDAKADEQKAWIQFQQAKRTLREAREKQHEVKLSRKYYKTGGHNSTWKRSTPAGGREEGPCFKCGAYGHKARSCPKNETAKIAEEMHEEAEFTYHTEEIYTTDESYVLDEEETPAEDEYKTWKSFESGEENIFTAHEFLITTEQAIQQGKAVVDGGATKTMASLHALEKLAQANQHLHGSHGLSRVDEKERPIFGFGNSQKSQCVSTCHMKVPTKEHPMQLKVHVLEQGQAPVLLSIDTLRRMGAIIDFAADEVVFQKVNPQRLIRMERSQAGHQLLPLAEDFLSAGEQLVRPVTGLRSLVSQE